MSRRSADEISGNKELQRRLLRHRASAPAEMSAATRDRLIAALTEKGWPASKVASRLGMSRRGVEMALERIKEKGVGSGRIRAE